MSDQLPSFPGFTYDKDYYMSSSFYSRYIDDEIAKLKNGSIDPEYYYLASNGHGSPAKYKDKNIYYRRTPFVGSESSYPMKVKKMDSFIRDMSFNEEGWLETERFWVVNEVGMMSLAFRKACQTSY